jgi:hypothetical protein
MSGNDDVFAKDSFNGQRDLDGGDSPDVWGGHAGRMDDSGYTGGYHTQDGIPGMPNDPAAYRRAKKWSKSGRQEDVDRYRQMGADAANRPGVHLEYGTSDQFSGQGRQNLNYGTDDRGRQEVAANVMQSAAMGEAPSRAELLGRGLINQSLQSQLAGAASARGGPLAQMAAQRQVQNGAAAFQQQGTTQLAALRADEMERARSAWGQQLGQMRGQDYQGAGAANALAQTEAQKAQAQGQIDMQQRQLNQSGQLAYEGLGFDVNKATLQGALGTRQIDSGENQFDRQMDQASKDRDQRMIGAATGAAGDVMGHAVSDMRAKKPVPLLLDGGKKPKSADAAWLAQFMDRDKSQAAGPSGETNAPPTDQVQPYQDIQRDDPYAGPTPGGIGREDPYGSGEMFFSDEKAKNDLTGREVVPLGNTEQGDLKWGDSGAYYQPRGEARPALDGGGSGGSQSRASAPAKAKSAGSRQMTPEEMMRAADAMGRDMKSTHEQRMAQGPKVNPVEDVQKDANRRMAGFPYAYKDEYRPSEQAPGELNYGFSAQELEKNPITATAVRRDARGLRSVDVHKLVKTQAAGIASLQDQVDQIRGGR